MPRLRRTSALSSHRARIRAARSDGESTRRQILDAAARLYGDRGFAGTTSKDICAAAGTNIAAVNYHFGSKEALYEAVLIEAHGQLVRLGNLEAIASSQRSSEQKLRALLAELLHHSAGVEGYPRLRVLMREMLAPSNHMPALLREAVLPKLRIVLGIVAALLSLPVDHAAAQRALTFVVLPCIMLVLAPRQVLRSGLPGVDTESEELLDDMTRYALAGLEALKREYATERPSSGGKMRSVGRPKT